MENRTMSKQLQKEFRTRWKCFDGEPWFELVVDAYQTAMEATCGEYELEQIDKRLHETVSQRGIVVPAHCCGCGKELSPSESTVDVAECIDCKKEHAEALQRREIEEERVTRMSPEEKAEAERAFQLFMYGLISRDVQ